MKYYLVITYSCYCDENFYHYVAIQKNLREKILADYKN